MATTTFGEYAASLFPYPAMQWYAMLSYTRTSNSNIAVTVTVVGEIVSHKSTVYIDAGNSITALCKVSYNSVTIERSSDIKSSSTSWFGHSNNPRSKSFSFNVPVSAVGTSIRVSYSVSATGTSAGAAVPEQYTTFLSPEPLYYVSKPTVSAKSVDLGSTVTITTNRQLSTMTHVLTYAFGEATGTIAENVGASFVWRPQLALAAQIPLATSGACSITCTTYVGDERIGSNVVTLKLKVPASVVPTISLGTALVRTSEPASWGVAVQGYTKVQMTAIASGASGSTITGYLFSGSGYTGNVNPFTTGVIKVSGTKTFSATVYDSRMRSATTSASVTIYPYAAPKFTSVTAYRSTSSGTKDPSGTYIRCTLRFTFSDVNNKNSCLASVKYRESASETWSTATSITSGSYVVIGGGDVSIGSSYIVRFELQDGIQTVTKDVLISTVVRAIHFKRGGKGVAFGKIAENDNVVESAWNIHVNKDTKSIFIGTGNGHTNHGIYSNTASKWIAYADDNGDVHLPGNADSATNATNAEHADSSDSAELASLISVSNTEYAGELSTEYIPFISDVSQRVTVKANDGIKYLTVRGTSSSDGSAILELGNAIASGAAGNKAGAVRLRSKDGHYTQLQALNAVSNIVLGMPTVGGTLVTGAANDGYIVVGGMQVCWGKITATMGATTAANNHYYSNSTAISEGTFARAFSGVPASVILTGAAQTATILNAEVSAVTAAGLTRVRAHRSTESTAGYSLDLYYVAFGTAS